MRRDLHAQNVPEPVIDDAVLILSELLSNSCRHARPLGDSGAMYDAAPDPAGPRGQFGQSAASAPSAVSAPTATAAQSTASAQGTASALSNASGQQEYGIRAGWAVGADGLLKVEVTDGGGPTRPRPSSPSLTAHGGRGLGIVGSLALRWGVRDEAPGEVTVWALLPVRGRHARRVAPGSGGTGIGLPRGIPLDLPLDLAESLDDRS